jgi:adenylate cyclase
MEEVTGLRQRAATESGEWVQAAILSSDIRSFTTLTEKTPPEELVEGINSYYEAMQEEIEKQGGMILKIIGDAIIAVFFQENDSDNPGIRALSGARNMARKLKSWNEQRIADNRFPIKNGIGIAMGQVMACRLGISGGRLEFTVIGEAMQRAGELEALSAKTDETSIIVSENIASNIDKTQILGPADAEKISWKIME